MKRFLPLLALVLAPCLLPAFEPSRPVGGTPEDTAFYVGKSAKTRLDAAFRLSDGTLLVGGGTESLGWLPKGVRIVALGGAKPQGGDTGAVPFLLRLSDDARKVLEAYTLPAGCAEGIAVVKTTSIPGEPTGDLYIGGRVRGNESAGQRPGYFIARLDGNIVATPATKLLWCRGVYATSGLLRDRLPWDVGPDGRVVFATGEAFAYDWLAVEALGPDGKPAVVPNWRHHWLRGADGSGAEFCGVAADAPGTVEKSDIVLKARRGRGDFRSWTVEDWKAKVPDGNGGYNQGEWPFDGMFPGPFDLETKETVIVDPKQQAKPGKAKGWYGYRWGKNDTATVGAIVVDRRDGSFFLCGSNQSTLPSGLPDFEPWVIAFDKTGKKLWWSRLYPESHGVSTPDQFVDDLAIDYSVPLERDGAIAVLARCHGNNRNNFWTGPSVNARGAGRGFQPQFTGRKGNIHYSWLGRFSARKGTLLSASYMGEYAEGTKHGTDTFKNPILAHWPHPLSGWPDINTTQGYAMEVDDKGRVYVVAVGRRVITTSNAFQQMPSPLADPGKVGVWSHFVRVYHQDLSDVDYSSLLTGQWNWDDGTGGSEVELTNVLPLPGGVLVVGNATPDKQGNISGNEMPTRNVPEWGADRRGNAVGALAFLKF